MAEFLHAQLNARITAAAWAAAINPPWSFPQPNHGFLLCTKDQVVGVYLAFYSDREIEGRSEQFCNLAAWCVLSDYRSHGLRLLRALLAQKGYNFTDFSPSGSVIGLNSQLKFSHLDVTTALVPNLPWPLWPRRVRVISKPAEIERTLQGRDLEIYRNHAGAVAARHLLVVKGDETCYVMFRKDRRKNLPLFASILHVGNRPLFRVIAGHVFRHMLIHHRIPGTLAETRVVGCRPRPSIILKSARPKMYRSVSLRPDQIDYLYSELTCVPW